jgi:23S rRNA (adenine2503-C2)-methyltransferase
MPDVPPIPERAGFFGIKPAELRDRLTALGWPAFRATQVLDWAYRKQVTDPARMTNLSKADRDTLTKHFAFGSASQVLRQDSADGTIKLLITWPDGSNAETVMIPDGGEDDGRRHGGERYTACVSSQVGCPVGCKFCASGLAGLKQNLAAAHIVEQIIQLNHILAARERHVTNVVFMGMGEPLANYANVMQAIRILNDPAALNIGARKITVSTVGVPKRIRDLADEDLQLNLALSLHAPNEPLRKQLIPWAEHFDLDDILDACRYYFSKTGREITLEYILLHNVNDRPEHAKQLAQVCRGMRANVNLLRYNEVVGVPFVRPKSESVIAFQEVLRKAGINAHVRKSRGRDIDAACGQLRRKEEREKLVQLGAGKAG